MLLGRFGRGAAMPDLDTVTCHGSSGADYSFSVYAWGARFKAVGAVYVVSQRRQRQNGVWSYTPIYIGETGDLSERFDDHHKAACIARHDPNCLCIHRESSQRARLQKEADLILKYAPPCND
jgi:hypothetical protein